MTRNHEGQIIGRGIMSREIAELHRIQRCDADTVFCVSSEGWFKKSIWPRPF
jgi:hypothetical protein